MASYLQKQARNRQQVRKAQAGYLQSQAGRIMAAANEQAMRKQLQATRVKTGAGNNVSSGVGWLIIAGAAFLLLRQSVTTPSATSTVTAPQLNCHATYVVQSGDTLSSIATQYGVSTTALVSSNQVRYPTLKTNPNLIQPGWALCIP